MSAKGATEPHARLRTLLNQKIKEKTFMTSSRAYTRTGDAGETGLFGGPRISKASTRIEAYGCVDELNSVVGLARAFSKDKELDDMIEEIQNSLFAVGADLATPIETRIRKKVPRISGENTRRLEEMTDKFDSELAPLKTFILPRGSLAASLLHLARTVCRRTERRIVALSKEEQVNRELLPYINRLSSLLFVLARVANKREGQSEIPWTPE